ncbi:hypothetical protein CKO35_05250 [Ectothiorhodospira shaposhnikovii]|uniref:pilus assembly PilX family protein n=1 Tax=Ectothiorhodospira shaposhnikovii TaxID=1054 RepID=UPI001906F10D|nr:PilX N-terminal domain-containing pilus assembly protein [Ectothiorhodospira shaposhnikovii]MBK1672715.1 hypothetical protein [Ectothiorhodospira shaposhnikovii]
MHTPLLRHSGQTGSALVIALVFLLLLTLIGVTAMQGTTLQERMAGNARDRNLSFQGAEAALRECEAWIDLQTVDIVTPALADPAAWDGSGQTCTYSINQAPHPTLLAADPVAHVAEPRLVRVNPVDPAGSGASGISVRSLYPVTSRSTGGVDTTVVVLQSICERPCRP